MKDQYYADNRDLVKWGILLTLAERYAAKHILQVLYYRHSEWADLEIDGETVKLPSAVLQHFRQAKTITAIKSPAPVDVIADEFHDRAKYFQTVLQRIRSRPSVPGIVFLDPDTGLESATPSLTHVLNTELSAVWNALQPGDVLVFYQHQTNRSGQPWVEPKKEQFERALGVPAGTAKTSKAESIARDVAFLYALKHNPIGLEST
jgi:hypothetical protein